MATVEALREIKEEEKQKISQPKKVLDFALDFLAYLIFKWWLLIPIGISVYGGTTNNPHTNYTLWYVNILLWLLSAGFNSQKSKNTQ